MRKRLAKVMAGSMLAGSLVLGGAGMASAGGGGCFHETSASVGEGTNIDMIDNCFQATVLRVAPRTDVTWTNQDAWDHTITGVGGTWGSIDAMAPGERVAYSFAGDGVYVYSCLIHPGMVGAVVVGSGRGDGGLQPVEAAVAPGAGDGPGGPAARGTSAGGLASELVGGAVVIVLGLGILGAIIARRRTVRVA